MPLTSKFQPLKLLPDCIWIDFIGNKMLNAVGLSGPGTKKIFSEGFWNSRWPWDRIFMISVSPEGQTPGERFAIFELFIHELRKYKRMYKNHRFGLQINLSCPNSDVAPATLIHEAGQFLDLMRGLDIPVIIKVNLLVPVTVLKGIAQHPACDAICITNTLPFGELPNRVPWEKWFPNGSPLKKYKGGGGLSGAPLFPLLVERVRELKAAGIRVPLIAGGGITHPKQVTQLVEAGLVRYWDAVSIGSIATLRPWNIKATIWRAHDCLGYIHMGA